MTTTTIKLPFPVGTDELAGTIAKYWEVVQVWRSRARQRRHLALLTPGQLEDVGISPEAARYEIAKPFWREG